MPPSYLDKVKANRQSTGERQAHDADIASMVGELKKVQMAALMGAQGKSTVILTDQTDLGDRLQAMVKTMADAVSAIDARKELRDFKQEMSRLRTLAAQALEETKKQLREDARRHTELVSAVKAVQTGPEVTVQVPEIQMPEIPAPVVNIPSVPVAPVPVMEVEPPDRFDLNRYRAQDISESGDKQYIGFVNPEGNWYIIENDVNGTSMRYVFGASGYTRHFRQASSYKYKVLHRAVADAL